MTNWIPPVELPDQRRADLIALDLETKDDGLAADRGPGWTIGAGYICGVSVAWHEGGAIRSIYVPIRHPDTANFDRDRVFGWLRDLLASDVRVVTQGGLYDYGWLRSEAGISMPPGERIEEIGALAVMIDENRRTYGLDDLCRWRGLAGKDTALLDDAVTTLLPTPKKPDKKPKAIDPRPHIYKLPARLVRPYAEQDAIATLALFESIDPARPGRHARGVQARKRPAPHGPGDDATRPADRRRRGRTRP